VRDSYTDQAVHNKMYKLDPPLTLDDFKHCKLAIHLLKVKRTTGGGQADLGIDLYWDNRGWGSKQETARMVVCTSLP
jgi:hypothetical protein